ncbi:hypothetical protein CC2G_011181 [Coprinopsis cinerea AmutBmut pab1-1]|nr:hypothetical protein CC2G_011181 [Coprinopsis cinerea AmutBmut pab1-1]
MSDWPGRPSKLAPGEKDMDSILEGCRTGDIDCLKEAVFTWPIERAAELLGAIVPHLDLRKLPKRAASDKKSASTQIDTIHRALLSIEALEQITDGPPDFKVSISTQILPHLEEVLDWAFFITHNTSMYCTTTDMARGLIVRTVASLVNILKTDDRLTKEALRTEARGWVMLSFLHLKVPKKTWDDPPEPVFVADDPRGCLLLHLAFVLFSGDEPQQVLHIPRFTRDLIDMLLLRVPLVGASVSGAKLEDLDWSTVASNYWVIVFLLKRIQAALPHIANPMLTTKAFQQLMETTVKVLDQGILSDQKNRFASAIGTLREMALRHDRVHDGLLGLIRGGYFQALMIVGRHPTDISARTEYYFQTASTFPLTPLTLNHIWNFVKGEEAARISEAEPNRFTPLWTRFCDKMTSLSASLRVLRVNYGYCDSPQHPHIDNVNHRIRPHFCSSCHTVSYCSRGCQKHDWKARHRDECADARHLYLEHKTNKTWISRSLKRFYFACIEIKFNTYWRSLQSSFTPSQLELIYQIEPWVTFFNTTLSWASIQRFPAKKYPFIFPQLVTKPEFLDRLDSFLEPLGMGGYQDVRVAEGRFTGPKGVAVLVMVRMQLETVDPGEQGSYWVTNGIVRTCDAAAFDAQFLKMT